MGVISVSYSLDSLSKQEMNAILKFGAEDLFKEDKDGDVSKGQFLRLSIVTTSINFCQIHIYPHYIMHCLCILWQLFDE